MLQRLFEAREFERVHEHGFGHTKVTAPAAGLTGSTALALSLEDIRILRNAMAIAPKQLRSATAAVSEVYALGPHGPWILGLIDSSRAVLPSSLTKALRCGKSQVTFELKRLSAAGLIECRKSDLDGRKIELRLTPMGKAASERVRMVLVEAVRGRLAHYTREDIMFCVRLLQDLAGSRHSRARRNRTWTRSDPNMDENESSGNLYQNLIPYLDQSDSR